MKTKRTQIAPLRVALIALAASSVVMPQSGAAPFTDANWVSMGSLPGANGTVRAAVVDGSGNLYIAGSFTMVGDVFANYIAKWNGSSWSALGSRSEERGVAVEARASDGLAVG